jgi:hypothetical protein
LLAAASGTTYLLWLKETGGRTGPIEYTPFKYTLSNFRYQVDGERVTFWVDYQLTEGDPDPRICVTWNLRSPTAYFAFGKTEDQRTVGRLGKSGTLTDTSRLMPNLQEAWKTHHTIGQFTTSLARSRMDDPVSNTLTVGSPLPSPFGGSPMPLPPPNSPPSGFLGGAPPPTAGMSGATGSFSGSTPGAGIAGATGSFSGGTPGAGFSGAPGGSFSGRPPGAGMAGASGIAGISGGSFSGRPPGSGISGMPPPSFPGRPGGIR